MVVVVAVVVVVLGAPARAFHPFAPGWVLLSRGTGSTDAQAPVGPLHPSVPPARPHGRPKEEMRKREAPPHPRPGQGSDTAGLDPNASLML